MDDHNPQREPIIIGSDHAAYRLKECVKSFLVEKGYPVEDVGAFSETSVDYPDVGIKVAAQVSVSGFKKGILLCGTGIGMSMVANKFRNVRAALCTEPFAAEMSRRHNDANILVMGGRVTGEALALEMVDRWLSTAFEGGRHQSRLRAFDQMGEPGG